MTDEEIFLASMGDVTPIAHNNQAQLERKKLEPTIAQLEKRKSAEQELVFDSNFLSTEYVDLLEPEDILSYKKQGVQEGVFKNLRTCKYQIDATLNIHNQRLTQSRALLFDFITQCHQHNIRVVLITHGKGYKSKPFPAILKSYINKWLQQLPQVLAFHSALGCHGGSGATYLLLKKSDEKRLENKEKHAKR
jgi:DNA-nicking Smr family endonuclease